MADSQVALTFPDGARREFPKNITGLDIAKGISPSLAKRTVAMALDGGAWPRLRLQRDAPVQFGRDGAAGTSRSRLWSPPPQTTDT